MSAAPPARATTTPSRAARRELNTAWTRYGATGAFGYQIDETSRVEGTVRSDGIYNAGFRGSSANLFAFDTRYN